MSRRYRGRLTVGLFVALGDQSTLTYWRLLGGHGVDDWAAE